MFKQETELNLSEDLGKRITDWCDMDEVRSNSDIKKSLLAFKVLDELAEFEGKSSIHFFNLIILKQIEGYLRNYQKT